MTLQNRLISVEETNKLVNQGRKLVLAASESALAQIQKGNWIGGTIPYFMDKTGGKMDSEQVFVTDFTDYIVNFKIKSYSSEQIEDLLADRFSDGFTYLLLPGFSEIHSKYALVAGNYSTLFDIPTLGWITGVDLSRLGELTPKVINGVTGEFMENAAMALHVEIPEGKFASMDIVNLFEQGNGDSITFKEDGFSAKTCEVNGVETNLADYIVANNIDTRLPLVADYSGAMINTSFQSVDAEEKNVVFYAPILENYVYKLAASVENYVAEFNKLIPADNSKVICSCNCILNYLYSELEGKTTASFTGPFTFGEIAYVLVNQTMVLLTIE